MTKAQCFRMQAKPVTGRQGLGVGIEIIAEDRVSEMEEMDAQLV